MIEEIDAQIEPFKEAIKRNDASLQEISITQGLKGKFGIIKESKVLLEKCEQAISLASKGKTSKPDRELSIEEDGVKGIITPDKVIALFYIEKSIIVGISGNYKETEYLLKRSLEFYSMAETQLILAYIILAQGKRKESILAIKKVVDSYPDSDEASEANKVILDLNQTKPRKWKVALFLSIFLGLIGVDRFYLGYIK